jgi:hypothetical protein
VPAVPTQQSPNRIRDRIINIAAPSQNNRGILAPARLRIAVGG